ncbi:glycoside hydrolase family 19 protein [Lacinutrix sp. Hel_I_90]|uniref:glycoside hydrolase family 19 protein n=1 Tax=Lacinutrix sp. Hel_I_90 TaxID=1249999 RepID=UPI000695E1E7|nr:glycoside hydrolase family 19 protein [Lacinutrix sp. Hel_I_90]
MSKALKITGALVASVLFFGFRRSKGNAPISATLFNTVKKATINAFGNLNSDQIDALSAITNAFITYGDGDNSKLAYIIATAWHESRFKPVRECFANTDAQARQCVKTKPYGLPVNGKVYYGRGYVQLTWSYNYEKMANWLGLDLVNNPDIALRRDVAAKIIVYGMYNGTFTTKKLSDYIGGNYNDFYNARRIVNGLDKAQLINDYAISLVSYNA